MEVWKQWGLQPRVQQEMRVQASRRAATTRFQSVVCHIPCLSLSLRLFSSSLVLLKYTWLVSSPGMLRWRWGEAEVEVNSKDKIRMISVAISQWLVTLCYAPWTWPPVNRYPDDPRVVINFLWCVGRNKTSDLPSLAQCNTASPAARLGEVHSPQYTGSFQTITKCPTKHRHVIYLCPLPSAMLLLYLLCAAAAQSK